LLVTSLGNPSSDTFGSALLQATLDASAAAGYSTEVTGSEVSPKEKGTLLTEILIGAAGSALWDILVASINRLRSRPDYRPDVKVSIDGNENTVEIILDKANR
jgi:hypothetical protein